MAAAKFSIGDVRVCNFCGYAFILAEGRKWVRHHRWVWEKRHGPIPKGFVIHHKDGNKLNNKLRNLELMSRGEHQKAHHSGASRSQETRERLSKSAKRRVEAPGYREMLSVRAKKQHEDHNFGHHTWTENSKNAVSEKAKKRGMHPNARAALLSEESQLKKSETWRRKRNGA